jgi:hypothetical protein
VLGKGPFKAVGKPHKPQALLLQQQKEALQQELQVVEGKLAAIEAIRI